ncbi:hypothetical protein CTAYLR_007511 [Chrysophaeum taylorii]|uniref:Uncharacterized protein n=1 Tax=Chrysophaeum taylorii TaxID=2483200 RepID=A0AAD7UKL4_9STRA|nr:hypothetical protein CTAYLR_007511 [Chrysophaeum taylorii]
MRLLPAFVASVHGLLVTQHTGHRRLPQRFGARMITSTSLAVADVENTVGPGRPPYALSGLPRPKLRGAVMGYLHKSKSWYLLACAYLTAAFLMLPRPVQALDIFLRLGLVGASSASVAISDGYHNPDRRSDGQVEGREELFWLRLDYISISAMLSTNLLLWAANLGWVGLLPFSAAATTASTAAVVAASLVLVPRRTGHVFVKLTMAFQFVCLLGYLVICAITSPTPACSSVYFCYLPGFILYATKWPKHKTFGYHEIFHSSVLLGHMASMGFDLWFLR